MNQSKSKFAFVKPELSVEELSLALYHANQKLMLVNSKLKESERMRMELFSNLSHDLRSPLTTIQSNVEYLLSFDKFEEEEVIASLNLMNGKLIQLDYLITQLLMISTLDSSTEGSLDLQPIQIGMFLEDFFYSCEADKKFSDRRLILSVPKEFPYYSLLDAKLFIRLLDNLFSNALKYSSSKDSIILNALVKDQEIIITVSDTGIGIAEENLTKIFNRTYMVSNARTPNSANGCGLGLSIAQSIIEKHHGRIWCDSQLGKGSTFYIVLPQFMSDDTV